MGKTSTFAERLNELLIQKNITKAELSRRTGVSRSSLTHYAKGDWEGKQDAIYAIAQATGVDYAWLMGHDVPMEANATSNSTAVDSLMPDTANFDHDAFTYAAHKYTGDLRPEDKDTIIKMMQTLAAANKEDDKHGESDRNL